MQSCAWMNGQYRQVGQPSQAATQVTYDNMRNQQAGTANNYFQFVAANSGLLPPQSDYPNFSDGGNRPVTYCQTLAAPHQTVSSQQLAGQKDSNFYSRSPLQSSSSIVPPRNPGLLVTNRCQAPAQHNFHHNSAPIVSPRSPPNMATLNTRYPQQNVPLYLNQPVHKKSLMQTQDYRVQNALHQNVKGKLMQPISAYNTTALSLMCKQPTGASNRQAGHRQNGTHHGLPCSPPPSYTTASLQSVRNNSFADMSLLDEQILRASSMNQTQQFAPQLNTTQSRGQEATCVVNSNPYSNQCDMNTFLSKTNNIPFNPTTAAQQIMPTAARIADGLQTTDTAGSDAYRLLHTNSSCRGMQVHSEVRMMESNLILQPLTTAEAHFYNSNSTLFSAASGQHLSNAIQTVTSRTHHSANGSPQQKSAAADSFSVTAAGDGSQNGNQADGDKRCEQEYLNVVSQLKQMLERVSPPINKPQLSAANSKEVLENLSPVEQIDSSIHSGTRAVAIVQPLSQECYQVASRCTSFNATEESGDCSAADKYPDNVCVSPVSNKHKAVHSKEDFNLCTENANQMRHKVFAMNHSATLSDDIVVPLSSLTGPQGWCLKQLNADDTRSELANMQVDQQVETAVQQSATSEVPGNQKSKMEKRKMPSELSSLPTIPWTTVKLSHLIMNEEKAQRELKDFIEPNSAVKILNMFWGGNCKMLADKIKAGWYKNLITKVRDFSFLVKDDTHVLLQVAGSISELDESFHVLKHAEVHSEPTYKSSWLNVNEQVDDIDKEFGFSWPVRHHHVVLERDSEPDQDRGIGSIKAQIESEVPNKVLTQTKLTHVDSDKEKKAPTPESTSPQDSSPCKTDCADFSDPLYAFQIQVLPPEVAKDIFEQVQDNIAQSTDMDGRSEEVVNSPTQGELHEVEDVTLEKSQLKDKSASAVDLQQVCCISKWLEKFVRSDELATSKCQCKEKQSPKHRTDETLVKKETIVERHFIDIESKFHCAEKSESQGSDCDDQDSDREKNQVVIFSCPDFSDEHSENIDLNEANKPHRTMDKETEDISHNSSQSSVVLISEDEAQENSSSEKRFPKQIPALSVMNDSEEGCPQDQLKSSVKSPSNDSESAERTEGAKKIADNEEHREQAQQTSTDVTTSSPESPKGKYEAVKRKRKTLSSKHGILPFVTIIKKCKPADDQDSQPVFQGVTCKKDLADAPETKPLATNGKTVKLMLFGSAPQDKCDRPETRITQVSSQKSVASRMPPKVLIMHLSPLRKMGNVPSGPHSAKQRIFEKWRSRPPAQIKQRGKVRMQKRAFASISGISFKKTETVTHTMEPPVSSEMRMWNKISKLSLSRKRMRRMSLSTGGKSREEKMKNGVVTSKHSVDEVRGESDSGSRAGMPLKENLVLGFNVLPNTFDFKYGSSEIKETTDPVSDKPAENEDKYPNKSIMRDGGTTWCPNPDTYCPPTSPTVPKTPGLFQQFQKKYVQKTQETK